MPFFGNKRRDFSIQPPRQQVDGTPFFVTDSDNIDFTLENLNLTANLTLTGVAAGIYGDATNIPVLEIDQWGRVTGVTTVPIGGGPGGTYTVNNGLTESPANNFQLGGTLIQDTSITGTTLHNLTLLGNYTGKQVLIVTNSNAGGDAIKGNSVNGKAVEGTASGSGTGVQGNSNNGNAVVGVSTSGSGVRGQSTSGIGGSFSSTSGVGVQGASDADYAGKFTRGTSLNNSVIQNVLFRNITTNFPALNGFGVSLVLDTNTTNFATLGALAEIKASWTDANHGSRTSKYEIYVTNNTNLQRVFNLSGPGQLTLDKYGQTPANFPGTAVWSLGVDALGNVIEFTPSTGTGTVTSVAATVPNPTNPAFSVNVPNPTTTPSINITANGIVSQYIRGDGSLANFPNSTGGGASVNYYLNGSVSQGTFGGVAMREINKVPIIGAGTDFTINADGYIQSFITDAGDPNQLAIPAGNWNFEMFFSASSGGGSPQFYIELYKWDGATLTLIASNSATPENITGGTSIDLYTTALTVPQTTLALTDRLAVRVYVIHSGRIITLHTEDNHLCQIITTFTTGLTALNGLTDQIQNFASPGTSGTAPNWNSVSPNHTLNIPLASATGVTAGLISKADYDVFNGKQNAITLTTTGTSGPATFVSNTLNIPQYGGGSGGNSIASLSAASGDVSAAATSASETNVVATLKANLKTGSCGVTFDGGGQVVQNKTAYVQMPYNGTLGAWSMVADQAGACTITVSKGTFGTFPPTSAVYSTQPAIPATNITATSPGAYNPGMATVTAGDVLKFDISGVSTITWVNLTISITKT